jgi:hypothetical protein
LRAEIPCRFRSIENRSSVHKLSLPTLIAIGIGTCTVINGARWYPSDSGRLADYLRV